MLARLRHKNAQSIGGFGKSRGLLLGSLDSIFFYNPTILPPRERSTGRLTCPPVCIEGRIYPTLCVVTRVKRATLRWHSDAGAMVGDVVCLPWAVISSLLVHRFQGETHLVSCLPANKPKNLFLRRRSRMLHVKSARDLQHKWSNLGLRVRSGFYGYLSLFYRPPYCSSVL